MASQLYFFHDQRKHYIPIHDGLVIGRSKGDLNFEDDPLISRQHCRILIIKGEAYLEDLGSTNPTRVNRVPLLPNRRRRLLINDVVKVGEQRLILTTQTLHKPAGTQEGTVFMPTPEAGGGRELDSSPTSEGEHMTVMVENPDVRRRGQASWKQGRVEVRGMPLEKGARTGQRILNHPLVLLGALGILLWWIARV